MILATAAPATDGTQSADPRLFPRPAVLEPQIRFWRAVFTEYSTHQVVLHDAFDLDKVYKVLDFRRPFYDDLSAGEVERLQRVETDVELERVRATLLRLHTASPGPGGVPEGLTAEEQTIYDLFADDHAADRFLVAADTKRLRTQRGLRERFADGIRISRRYLPEMERIFRAEGLPVELTRLPLIESCFNVRAYSKAGAAGIWQFMPSTGRLFMRVDHLVDERRDPITSTRAAAHFLRKMHVSLDTWPLAITAYNHGPQGIRRAVDEIGTTDIGHIVREYRGSAFGFASRNFYAEFLAALDVERDHRAHFGDLPPEEPLRVHEHELERPIGIAQAAEFARCDRDEIASLNPGLSEVVIAGRRPIPAGYRLRLPEAAEGVFASQLASLPEPRVTRAAARSTTRKSARPVRRTLITHRVRPGQTLSHIARQHRVSVASLKSVNRLGRAERLRAGQVLRIPIPPSTSESAT
jgi:membrane-bound lytic murein transglycosylase D